jgi:hypothetical protein
MDASRYLDRIMVEMNEVITANPLHKRCPLKSLKISIQYQLQKIKVVIPILKAINSCLNLNGNRKPVHLTLQHGKWLFH